ncbi:hypothetical protein BDV12DRAFT_60102 [Aspergillus spectabilis]
MKYHLSLTLSGSGLSDRAHWGLVIYLPSDDFGDLLHVRVIDIPTNRFQFENRSGHGLAEQDAWGLAKTAELDSAQRMQAISIVEREKPPTGEKDCQDWVVDALIALEVEELVPDGMVEIWTGRLGRATEVIKREVEAEGGWISLNGH